MTINEAIDILEKAVEATSFVPDHPLRLAQKLGSEALDAVRKSRILWGDRGVSQLPGETKE